MKYTNTVHVSIDLKDISLPQLCKRLRDITNEIEQLSLDDYHHYFNKDPIASLPQDFCSEYEYSIETNIITTSYQ